MSSINIIQHGIDGFGHQLHGLFSCMLLHNIGNYYFDGIVFINKIFKFQHIQGSVANDTINYMKEIVKQFNKIFNIKEKKYVKSIHSHEIYNIPNNYSSNILYTLDNAYYFEKIPINDEQRKQHINNIKIIKKCFINNNLPKNRLVKNNIVIHFRLGDAMRTGRRDIINKYNKNILDLLNVLLDKYKDHIYYLHTDGNIDFFTDILTQHNIQYHLFSKSTPILEVLSDFIHSKVFISGASGLSTVCTFLGNHELVIISDDTKHSVPSNAIRISNYINNNV